MIDLLRRRNSLLSAEAIPPLPYPDAFMVVFSCNANTAKSIMQSKCIRKYVLDGVETTPASAVSAVTPTTSGRHILYFWLNKAERLISNVDVSYVRIPENPPYLHGAFIYNSWSISRIDFLAATPPSVDKNNFGIGYGTRSIYIRCPKGSYAAYDYWIKNNIPNWLKNNAVLSETNDFSFS